MSEAWECCGTTAPFFRYAWIRVVWALATTFRATISVTFSSGSSSHRKSWTRRVMKSSEEYNRAVARASDDTDGDPPDEEQHAVEYPFDFPQAGRSKRISRRQARRRSHTRRPRL